MVVQYTQDVHEELLVQEPVRAVREAIIHHSEVLKGSCKSMSGSYL
jgi:hypothetical protein